MVINTLTHCKSIVVVVHSSACMHDVCVCVCICVDGCACVGSISYDELVAACIHRKLCFSEERLHMAFLKLGMNESMNERMNDGMKA